MEPLDADMVKIKWCALIGPFLYLPWYWGMQYLYPGSWNPFLPRFLVSVFMWIVAGHLFRYPDHRRRSVLMFEAIFMLMVVHHFVMAFYNDHLIVYRYTFFLISVMSGALMMSMRSYVALIAIVMICKAMMFFKVAEAGADLKFEIFEFVLWFFQFVIIGYLVNSIFKSRTEIIQLGQKAAEDAVAIEAAKSSRLEAEKKLLENDIEVAATVQTLLLPKAKHIQHGPLEVGAYFQPASKAGGDWWWFSKISESRYRLVVGDVTGHGAGAAMVTALLAGCYQTISESMKDAPTEDVLRTLNKVLSDSCGERHWVTLLALEIDPIGHKAKAWSMAAPQIFFASGSVENAKLEILTSESPSRPLGGGELHFETFERAFSPGDQIMVFTDGMFEFVDKSGEGFGLRRLKNLFKKSLPSPSVVAQVDEIAASANSSRRDPELEDDMTFTVIRFCK